MFDTNFTLHMKKMLRYDVKNRITVYCPRGCNVVDIPAERVSEECASCGSRMTTDDEDGFYYCREELPLQQFEENLDNNEDGGETETENL